MTIAQAAAALNRSEVTLRRWIKSGKIEARWVDCGRLLDISQEEIIRIKAGDSNAEKTDI